MAPLIVPIPFHHNKNLLNLQKKSKILKISSPQALQALKLYKLSSPQALQALSPSFQLSSPQALQIKWMSIFHQLDFWFYISWYGTFSLSNKQWEALNLSLSDTPQIPFTQFTDFNASSDIPTTPHHIHISSPEVSTTNTTLKSGDWKYFNKVTIDRVRRVRCKLRPNILCLF